MFRKIKALKAVYGYFCYLYAVRSNVTIDRPATISWGCILWAPDRLHIGPSFSIGRNSVIWCNGTIGRGVLFSSHCAVVGRYDHDRKALGRLISEAPWIGSAEFPPRDARHSVTIEDDVWVGFGATILSGIRIGRGAIVAAGAVVTSDVGPYAIVAGNPARQIGNSLNPEEIAIHEQRLAGRQS